MCQALVRCFACTLTRALWGRWALPPTCSRGETGLEHTFVFRSSEIKSQSAAGGLCGLGQVPSL